MAGLSGVGFLGLGGKADGNSLCHQSTTVLDLPEAAGGQRLALEPGPATSLKTQGAGTCCPSAPLLRDGVQPHSQGPQPRSSVTWTLYLALVFLSVTDLWEG